MNATNMISFVILRNWQSKEKHMVVCKLATKETFNSFNNRSEQKAIHKKINKQLYTNTFPFNSQLVSKYVIANLQIL